MSDNPYQSPVTTNESPFGVETMLRHLLVQVALAMTILGLWFGWGLLSRTIPFEWYYHCRNCVTAMLTVTQLMLYGNQAWMVGNLIQGSWRLWRKKSL